MGKNLFSPQTGFTIIEALCAGAILVLIAIGILPSALRLADTSQGAKFKSVCNSIVKAKMQEYLNGEPQEYLAATPSSMGFIPSGFEYAKRRYMQTQSIYDYCTNATVAKPGFRELITMNQILGWPTQVYTGATSFAQEIDPISGLYVPNLKGFQLYVRLTRYNPRQSDTNNQPLRDCPPATDQFLRVGDALEVTVTGMIMVQPTVANGGRGGAKFGPYDDEITAVSSPGYSGNPNQVLTCATSQIVYPARAPFRYYLGSDGKIRNYQTNAAFVTDTSTTPNSVKPDASAESVETQFRSIWSQAPGLASGTPGLINSGVFANIRGFSVAPDNSRVYVLRAGELTLYRNCVDRTVYMGAGGTLVYPSIPDCTPSATPNCTGTNDCNWSMDPNITSIAVNFPKNTNVFPDTTTNWQSDIVYTLPETGTSTTSGSPMPLGKISPWPPVGGIAVNNNNIADYGNLLASPRITGIFIQAAYNQSASMIPRLFFLVNSCYIPSNNAVQTFTYTDWSHCVSAYSSDDSTMQMVSKELPVQVDAVSN